MAQETTGSRADPLAIPLGEPIDWERRIAAARLRREATLAQRSSQTCASDPRAIQARMPARAARPDVPPRTPTAGLARPAPAIPEAALAGIRNVRLLAAALAGSLGLASVAARRNPAPVAAAASLAGILLVTAAWLATRPDTPSRSLETAALAPAVSDASTVAAPAAPPLPKGNLLPATDSPPVPRIPPLAAPAGLPEALALPATDYGARVRTPAPAGYELSARVAAADFLDDSRRAPAATIDAALIRGLVASALAE